MTALDGFTLNAMTFGGETRDVYRRGSGPGVVVMHEIPGITPTVARFARITADAGFTVFMPTLSEPAGLPRLDAIVNRWVHHGNELTALIASHYAVNTFDDDPDAHPDALRTRLVNGMLVWRQTLERTVKQALDRGHVRPDTDPEQMVFEIFSLLTGFLYDSHVKRDPKCYDRVMSGYARLMSTYRSFAG